MSCRQRDRVASASTTTPSSLSRAALPRHPFSRGHRGARVRFRDIVFVGHSQAQDCVPSPGIFRPGETRAEFRPPAASGDKGTSPNRSVLSRKAATASRCGSPVAYARIEPGKPRSGDSESCCCRRFAALFSWGTANRRLTHAKSLTLRSSIQSRLRPQRSKSLSQPKIGPGPGCLFDDWTGGWKCAGPTPPFWPAVPPVC